MKARALRKVLNNTQYIISNHEKYIAVGSPLCHDLIKVMKDSLNITYALDTFREGRKALRHNEELLFIWDMLVALVNDGEINNYIDGSEEVENGVPVFYYRNNEIIESVTEAYGWPNIDTEGYVLYDRAHFSTRKGAIDYAIDYNVSSLTCIKENKERIQDELAKTNERLAFVECQINKLKAELL